MTFAFPAAPAAAVPISGSAALFPVHRVYCVGRNYAEHVKEMGGEVGRDPPFFFTKPADAAVTAGRFPYPPMSQDVHHEVELVVALGPGAAIFGHAIGIDMTRRDLQAAAKKLQRPWDTAKAFDFSAPLGPILPATQALTAGAIALDVNGSSRQRGDLSEMIWRVDEIIAELDRYFALRAGDLIFTGTPSGVGPVSRGDRMEARIAGLGTLTVDVV
ncbi:MAG: fumarylacetoacetate hydrolase family protein [Proteobacteria bacterium]|nr:fumarylacetoacetate hydrolase family protein [Pseudomonadota bacterium]